MKMRCAGLLVVLFSLVAFGKANAEIEFGGVIDPKILIVLIDSVKLTSPDMFFLTPGWGSHPPFDSHGFTGVTAWPASVALHGILGPFPTHKIIVRPDTSTWYPLCLDVNPPMVKFYGTWDGGVEEAERVVQRQQCLTVSPSVVTGQMSVRLQPVGTGRPVVEIHDAAGNVIRSLDCTAGASGVATATWNREDDLGRPVPEGVYFCRYAGADVIAVRKVLVAD
jgi:hypothetical protein